MRIWQASDMLVHEYSEFEWEDFSKEAGLDEYLEQSVNAAKDRGLRYFNVLVKPVDDLLSDAKPNNPYVIDTWRWDARREAKAFVEECGADSSVYHVAVLAILALHCGATFKLDTEYGALRLYVPVRGIGYMQCRVPERMARLFTGLREETKERSSEIWDTVKVIETVLLMERANG